MDPKEFYELAKSPPAALIDDYPWLKKILADAPKGASLEGFLWPATYRVLPETTPEELVRLMLDKFIANVGEQRLEVPAARGLNFYQVMSLASIVEREAMLDEERPIIAGVYQNRIDGIPGVKNKILNADPTVFYAIDTLELDKLAFDDWQRYAFWVPPGVPAGRGGRPRGAAGLSDLPDAGPDPRPDLHAHACPRSTPRWSPTRPTSTSTSSRSPTAAAKHAFAKTATEHDENREKYGYIQ